MKPPGAMDAKRPGAFVSSDAGGTSNVNVGVTPAMLLLRPVHALARPAPNAKQLEQGGKREDRTLFLLPVKVSK